MTLYIIIAIIYMIILYIQQSFLHSLKQINESLGKGFANEIGEFRIKIINGHLQIIDNAFVTYTIFEALKFNIICMDINNSIMTTEKINNKDITIFKDKYNILNKFELIDLAIFIEINKGIEVYTTKELEMEGLL